MNNYIKILTCIALVVALCLPMSVIFVSASDVVVSKDFKVSLETVIIDDYRVQGCRVATNTTAIYNVSEFHPFDGSIIFYGWAAIDHGIEKYLVSLYANGQLKFYGAIQNLSEGLSVSQSVIDNIQNTGLDIVDFNKNARFYFELEYSKYINSLKDDERIELKVCLEARDSDQKTRQLVEINFVVDGTDYECSHVWANGVCTLCGATCTHKYAYGVCTICGYECSHDDYFDGGCRVCDMACNHPKLVTASGQTFCTSCGQNQGNFCDHEYVESRCTVCKRACTHRWIGGACYYCGAECLHDFGFGGNECELCGLKCDHSWSAGVCTRCGAYCNHSWHEGVCLSCHNVCSHNWGIGFCISCGVTCIHTFTSGACTKCGVYCSHVFSGGACIRCKITCDHEWNGRFCEKCGAECVHSWVDDHCEVCGIEYRPPCAHTWTDLTCTKCGITHDHMYYDGACVVCHVEEYGEPEDTEPEDTEPEDTEPEDTEPEDTEPEDTEPDKGGYWDGYRDAIKDITINPFDNSRVTLVVNGDVHIDVDTSLYSTYKSGSATLNVSDLYALIRLYCQEDIRSVALHIDFGKSVTYGSNLVDVSCGWDYVDDLLALPTEFNYFVLKSGDVKKVMGVYGKNESAIHGKYSFTGDLSVRDVVSGVNMTFGLPEGNERFAEVFENANIILHLNTLSQGIDSASYNAGYAEGNTDGYGNGYNDGYEKGEKVGYLEGKYDQPEGGFENLFFALFDSQAKVFQNMLNFEIFGINISVFLMSLMTIAIVGFVIKKVT